MLNIFRTASHWSYSSLMTTTCAGGCIFLMRRMLSVASSFTDTKTAILALDLNLSFIMLFAYSSAILFLIIRGDPLIFSPACLSMSARLLRSLAWDSARINIKLMVYLLLLRKELINELRNKTSIISISPIAVCMLPTMSSTDELMGNSQEGEVRPSGRAL
ncbi:hypothetical protein DSECCO2_642600 [anaerobic digester metagenome]